MNIPKHWQKVKLRDIVLAQKGKKPQVLKRSKFADSVPYLDIEAIEKGNILQYADIYSSVLATESDIFIVWDGSRSGLAKRGMNGAMGSTLMCITPVLINHNYLYHYLNYQFEYINANTIGNSIPHVDPEKFYNIEIPLPPLAEQQRIVEELEQQLVKYQKDFEEAKAELNKLEEYKKSVLDDAISGRLTKELRKQKEYSDWKIMQMKDITLKITDGEHQTPQKISKPNSNILLSAKNIRDGFIDFENIEYVSDTDFEKAFKRCDPTKGDILIVSVGATIGRCAKVETDKKFVIVRSIALIRCNPYFLLDTFLLKQLQSSRLQEIIKLNSSGNAQQSLYLNKIKQISISVPSLEEQDVIIEIVENSFNELNLLENGYKESIELNNNLQNSILQLAFSGQLSNVLVTDTSIANLLEQVKVEKEKMEQQRKEIQKENFKKRPKMNELTKKRTIKEILNDAGDKTLSVEELWQESSYHENNDVELFYEELVNLIDTEKVIKMEFDNEKIHTHLTLI